MRALRLSSASLVLYGLGSVLASPDVALLTCPGSNGQTYTTTDGANYTIECFYDRPYGDIAGSPFNATSLQNCINLCEAKNTCIDVAFYPPATGQQNGSCWEKSQVNSQTPNNGVWSARQVSGPTILTCPRSNGTSYTASDGSIYVVECYMDRPYNDLGTTQTPSLETCVAACETTNGCIDVSFSPPAPGSLYGTCWLKDFAGGINMNNNIWAARKKSVLSCPGSNGQTYRVADGATYTIECGIDRPYNDLSHPTFPSLEGCIAACEGNSSCVDVAWYPSTGVCWLKNAVGSSSTNANVWGARRLTRAPATTTTATTSACTPSPTMGTGKRGLGYNNATFTQPFSLSCGANKSFVSWAYNWGSSPYYPYSQATTGTFNPALRYIPMLWNNNSALTSIWNANANSAISNYMADSVLGFNEPDACQDGSACMSVSSAVSAWQTYIQPLGSKVKLISPAVTNSNAAGQGLSWLSSFISTCAGCQIDAIALHWYGDITSPSSFMTYIQNAYSQFGKPIWITEFGGTSGTAAQVATFLQTVLPWIDQQTYIVRAMYLMDAPNADGTWLINSNGTVSSIGSLYDQY